MEGENLKLALREVGKLIRKNLKQKFKEKDFYASGDLDKSFKYRVKDNELYIFGEQYANALSDGISTGGSSDEEGFKNLQSNIIKWAKIKGIRPQIRDKKGRFVSRKGLQFAIANSIYKKGIKPSLFFTKPFEKAFKNLPKELVESFALDVEQLIKTTVNNK